MMFLAQWEVPDIRSRVVFQQVGTPLTHELDTQLVGRGGHRSASKALPAEA